jgi:hypothetical protein
MDRNTLEVKIIFPQETKQIRDCVAILDHNGVAKRNDRTPKVTFDGEVWIASRLSYHLNNGSIPRGPTHSGGPLVLHRCDHLWCIAPEHLYLGDRSYMSSRYEVTPEVREKISSSQRGKTKSAETRAKMSAAHKGKPKSPDTRAKMSAAAKKRKPSKVYGKATLKDIVDTVLL